VNGDRDTHRYKGPTVFSEKERFESLIHCRWVDEIVEDAPWVITPAFLEAHDIDFVAHDDLPYVDASGTAADGDVYSGVKKAGRFYATQRTEGVSTSDLIARVLVGREEYMRRNLRRGASADSVGLTALGPLRLRLEEMGLLVPVAVGVGLAALGAAFALGRSAGARS
jgi:choline-phosphate cytidylyltransferase